MDFKKKIIFFVVFVLLIFGLLTYQSTRGERGVADFPIYPLKVLERGASSIIDFFRSYIPFLGKGERDIRLRLAECEGERTKYKEAAYENERLRAVLALKSERADFIAAAGVFARDPSNWFQIMWIDKGLESGIAKNMVAVTPLGPVGKVHRVLKDKAAIIQITDVNSSVAVRLQTSRLEGILEGRGDNRCYLKYISKDFEVAAGEDVITSGLDGIYPEGLLIGQVSEVDREGGEIFQLIVVVPSQDINKVEDVVILRK
ncbi:MAG: rod shape-determining protein MreC [Nitrospirae bacterium]|nr:rod shape-determining protein MreC [Nitrospirota bacterium]